MLSSDEVKESFFVNEECIACDACVIEAPECFQMNEKEGFAFVTRQPKTSKELAKCHQALECCPVEAIEVRKDQKA